VIVEPSDRHIYECTGVVSVDYQAIGWKGAIYFGRGQLRKGERIGLYPPPEFFVGIERPGVTAVPDPAIKFEQNWVPAAILNDQYFNGVVLSITNEQLRDHFKKVEAHDAV
jgi:hypothetical protein